MELRIKIEGRKIQKINVSSLTDARIIYEAIRDTGGYGASVLSEGRVYNGNKKVVTISYNGRVWATKNLLAKEGQEVFV